jgi:hypothetical protein
MKRAVFLCIAAATILLLALPSAPLCADSQLSAKTKSGPGIISPGVGTPGGGPGPQDNGTGGGGGGGGGGTDEGDADGLSGLKDGHPLGSSNPQATRNLLILELWWKFMILWAR